jgi:hypothetical protein
MALVRLASRAVIAAFDAVALVDQVIPELERLTIRPKDVSVLTKAEALRAAPPPPPSRGLLARLGKRADWRSGLRELKRPEADLLAGTGALAQALADSPSTSPVGALVMQGIPQRDALIYADLLTQGQTLLLVGVADRTLGERVRALLIRDGGEYVAYYAGRPYGTAFHGSGPGLK